MTTDHVSPTAGDPEDAARPQTARERALASSGTPEAATIADLIELERDKALTPADLLARKRADRGLEPPTDDNVAEFEANIERGKVKMAHVGSALARSDTWAALGQLRSMTDTLGAAQKSLGRNIGRSLMPPSEPRKIVMPPPADSRTVHRLDSLIDLFRDTADAQDRAVEVQQQVVEVLDRMQQATEASSVEQRATDRHQRRVNWLTVGLSAVAAVTGVVALLR